jgi:hypothetical protein
MFNENITVGELSEAQLKTVSGGLVVIAQIAVLIGLLLPAITTPPQK